MKKITLFSVFTLIPLILILILILILSCDLFSPASANVLSDPTPSPTPLPALTMVPTPTPPPAGNMIYNHDFSNGLDNWSLLVNKAAGAEASATAVAEEAVMTITQGRDNPSDIQFQQKYLHIVQDKTYRLSFQAKAASRTMYVEIGEDGYDNNNDGNKYSSYGGLTITLISATQMATYYIYITMEDPTDIGAQLIFNIGGSNNNLTIDNVTLVELP